MQPTKLLYYTKNQTIMQGFSSKGFSCVYKVFGIKVDEVGWYFWIN